MVVEGEAVVRGLLVLARVGGVLAAAPAFGRQGVPTSLRVLLGVVLSVVLVGFADGPLPEHAGTALGFGAAAAVEVVTGLLLGFAVRLVFWAVDTAGEIVGFQMSLTLAQVVDPGSGVASNPLGRLIGLLFMLLFVLLDGPQQTVAALARSFHAVPLGGAGLAAAGPLLLGWGGALVALAVRLSAPFVAALFLADVGMGVFARVVPQADLFSISLPLKLLAGLGIASAFVATFAPMAPGLFDGAFATLDAVIVAVAP